MTTLLKAIDTEGLGGCWEGKIEGTMTQVWVWLSSGPRESLQIVCSAAGRQSFPTWLTLARGHSELVLFPRIKSLLDPKPRLSTETVQEDLGSGNISPRVSSAKLRQESFWVRRGPQSPRQGE